MGRFSRYSARRLPSQIRRPISQTLFENLLGAGPRSSRLTAHQVNVSFSDETCGLINRPILPSRNTHAGKLQLVTRRHIRRAVRTNLDPVSARDLRDPHSRLHAPLTLNIID
jgi:hypothetical protein